MQHRVRAIGKAETEEPDDEGEPATPESDVSPSDDEKTLDDIIDSYTD
ncbi:hypothetical protein [Halovivax gelatinilyticus]|nr:hypothetical protein [Halovivax gelatinilyticus]